MAKKKHAKTPRPPASPKIPAWYRECDRLVTAWMETAYTVPGGIRRVLIMCARELHDTIHKLSK